MGQSYYSDRKYDDAERLYRQALRVYGSSTGPESAHAAVVLWNLASLECARGNDGDCSRHLREAEAVLERSPGPDPAWVGIALWNLATVHIRRKAYSEAASLLARAQGIFESDIPDHPALAGIQRDHAQVLKGLGREKEAREMRRRAHALISKAAARDRATVDWRDLAPRRDKK
jgi:tetratricopeptide (TPR) repeat protein